MNESLRLLQRPPLTDVRARLRLLADELPEEFDSVVVVARRSDTTALHVQAYGGVTGSDDVTGMLMRAAIAGPMPQPVAPKGAA